MPITRYRNYIGETIGRWEVLEELDTFGETPQARYGNRRFRVRHIDLNIKVIRTMASIRSTLHYQPANKRRVTELPCFYDYTGLTFDDWEVTGLIDDYLVGKGTGPRGSEWQLVNHKTGEQKVMTASQLSYHKKPSRAAQDPYYRIWTSLRNGCQGGTTSSTLWINFSAKGYTFDRGDWADFDTFKQDVIEQAGPYDESLCRYIYLMPIEGKHYCSGNIEWRMRLKCNRSFTEPGNLVDK